MERVGVGAHQLFGCLCLQLVEHIHVFCAHDVKIVCDAGCVLQVLTQFRGLYVYHLTVKS